MGNATKFHIFHGMSSNTATSDALEAVESLSPSAAKDLLRNLVSSGDVSYSQLRDQSTDDKKNDDRRSRTNGEGNVTSNESTSSSLQSSHPPIKDILSSKHSRHIALRIAYDGTPYNGFSENVGSSSDSSVERDLFAALVKLKLISGRGDCGYSRCGRTDKGVSAFGQIVALRLRSAFPLEVPEAILPGNCTTGVEVKVGGRQSKKRKGADGEEVVHNVVKVVKEYDYCKMLNAALPAGIRALSWTPVTKDFSARFSCQARVYRYFFVRRGLNLDAMRDGLSRIVGDHDFRNLAKMDPEHVSNFRRRIYSVEIVEPDSPPSPRDVCHFQIRGQAFLWHMVRNIVQVAFYIGRGFESPNVYNRLLDAGEMPRKPNYKMAEDFPLVLHRCDFGRLGLASSTVAIWELQRQLEGRWERLAIRAGQLRDAIDAMGEEMFVEVADLKDFASTSFKKVAKSDPGPPMSLLEDSDAKVSWRTALSYLSSHGHTPGPVKEATHVPLLSRKVGLSYEEKVGSMRGKKRERYEQCQQKARDGGDGEAQKAFYAKKQAQGSTHNEQH